MLGDLGLSPSPLQLLGLPKSLGCVWEAEW